MILRRLRPPALPLAVLVVLLAPAVAYAGGETVSTLSRDVAASGVRSVHLDGPVGEFVVTGSDRGRIGVTAQVRCERPVKPDCRERARRVELDAELRGDRLDVELDNWPHHKSSGVTVALTLEMPRDLPLAAELGVGEATVSGLESDLDLELGVGEVHVSAPEARVGRVSLEVGVGDAGLDVGGRHIDGKGFIGRELDWRGTGAAKLDVECGVGEIAVELTD